MAGLSELLVRADDLRRLIIVIVDEAGDVARRELRPGALDVARFEGACVRAKEHEPQEYTVAVIDAALTHLAVTAAGERLRPEILALPYEGQQRVVEAIMEWYAAVTKAAPGGAAADPSPASSPSPSPPGAPSPTSSPSTRKPTSASAAPATGPT